MTARPYDVGGRAYDVTVVVPVVERPVALDALYIEFSAPLREAGYTFEFVFVAYPWFRHLTQALSALRARGEPVRLLEVAQSAGETTLLKVAAASCRSPILVTLPAYLQTTPAVLPELVAKVEGGADLAVACRSARRDALVNRMQNRVLHLLVGRLAGGRLHDVACGVRAMRTELVSEVPLYGDFARFLPLLALREGQATEEVPAAVHPKAMRGRIYAPGVYLRRLIDVLGLFFLLKFTDKPLRFFGLIGSAIAGIGVIILLTVAIQRFGGQGLADRPVLLLGVLLITLGVQSVALGLIGEMIVHLSASQQKRYRLRRSSPPAHPDAA
ncbi:MAG TPA: hypothetical protein VFW66_10060 [Gemmatimonadales bacterium]|nr:hypothetical protein [Gemmatimonadales bacterium]